MLKLVDFTFDISWKLNVVCAVMVVPFHCDTTVPDTGPISGDFLLSAKHRHEVFVVLFSFVFYAKLVNNRALNCGDPFVCEQTSSVLVFMVARGVTVLHKAVFSRITAWIRPYIPIQISKIAGPL